MSEKAFKAKYPTGKIPKRSKAYGKTFICRRGCNTRTTTYTEEFIWEDIFHGTEDDVEELRARLKAETTATRRRGAKKHVKVELDFEQSAGEDEELETPRKKQKFSTTSTPRKPRTPSKLLTPSHKR
jgi:origin recognition complex subunit 1